MEKIVVGQQLFLLYKQDDAGHPVIHVVSTNIKEDGYRIDPTTLAGTNLKKQEGN